MSEQRTYDLVPQGDLKLRCATCERDITPGYPYVAVRRDPSRPDSAAEGFPAADALCVYCDELPA